MIKVGDTVRVISATKHLDEMKEFIPIGTICIVVDTLLEDNDIIVAVAPKDKLLHQKGYSAYWYLITEVEKVDI